MQTKHLDRIVEDRMVMKYALLAHATMYQAGQTDVSHITGQEHAVVAMHGPTTVAGVILYEWDGDENLVWLPLVHVDTSHRRAGVLSQMWEALLHNLSLRNEGEHWPVIRFGVMEGNDIARRAYESLGCKLVAYQYEYRL